MSCSYRTYKSNFFILIFTILFILPFLFSCSTLTNESHPDYFKSVFAAYDSVVAKKEEDIYRLNAAFRSFTGPGIEDRTQYYLRNCDYYQNYKREFAKTMAYADSIKALLESKKNKQPYPAFYARALFYEGDAYVKLGNYDKALGCFAEGKQLIATDPANRCELYSYTARLAQLSYLQAKYIPAAGYYKQVCDELQDCWQNDFEKFAALQGNLDNAGIAYARAGVFDSANIYFNKAIAFVDENKTRFPEHKDFMGVAKGVIYGNYADIFLNRKDTLKAEQILLASVQETTSKDAEFTNATLLAIAGIYLRRNDLKKTDSLLRGIREAFANLPITSHTALFYKTLSDYYKAAGLPDSALASLQKHYIVKDTLREKKESLLAVNVKNEFEILEQKAINQLLKKDNELKKVYLFITGVLSFMTIIILLLVWNNFRRSSRYVKELKQLNTEISRKNDDLRLAFQSLEQSHNENSRIIRIIAHDLKNPISVVNNLAINLLKKEELSSGKNALSLIHDAAGNSLSLINEILNQEKTNEDIGVEIVNMKKLLDDCISLLQVKASEKNQQLKLDAEEVFVKMNQQKIWRVISNILNNAIKFSPEHTDIDITLRKKEDRVMVSVRDYGIGIPEELQDKIFSAGSEARRMGTSGEKSYGLGLSIAKNIVTEHNGRLWFTSTPGKGTVFTMELPA